jgi:hypothetical protein
MFRFTIRYMLWLTLLVAVLTTTTHAQDAPLKSNQVERDGYAY